MPSWLQNCLRLGRKGSISLIMAGSALPLMVAIGVGVDMSRMTLAKTSLQAAVDAAALAGANAYVSANTQNAAKTAGVSYFDKFTQAGAITINSRGAIAQPGTLSGALSANSSYNVTVSASAKLPTTFMNVAGISNLTITAHAIAANPVVQPVLSHGTGTTGGIMIGNLPSNASDWNSIYVYAVPLDGSGNPQWSSFPPSNEIIEIGSNCSSAFSSTWTSGSACNGLPRATFTNAKIPPVALNQPLAIILINNTGGVINKGASWYGSPAGNFVAFTTASLAMNEPLVANSAPDKSIVIVNAVFGQTMTNQAVTNSESTTAGDCSLIIAQVDPSQTPVRPTGGHCFNLTDPAAGLQFANLSCAQMAGRTFAFWWNDMGGHFGDDLDYNNAEFMMTCALPSTIGTTSTTSGPPVGTPAALLE